MFTGEEVNVTLRCENDLAGVFIDRFGTDVYLAPDDDNHFIVSVKVAMSNPFLGWVFSLGSGAQIIRPESAVQRMREEAARLMSQYPLV